MNKILEPSTAKCELSVSSSEYQIRSMPVLSQFDPLLQYSPYWPLANGKPPPGQPPKFFVGNNADCYNTSIVSLIIAALANREQTRLPKPSGRTATFDQIPPSPPVSWNPPANETTPPATIPKEINQLAYYLKTLKETNNYLYYPGVLTDFGPVYQNPRLYNGSNNLVFTSNYGATFRDWLTRDTTHVTNEYVISLMRNNFVVMLAYRVVTPQVDKEGNVTFHLEEGHHKMPVSGFQDGPSPLKMNSIYRPGQQCARITPVTRSTRLFGDIRPGAEHAPVEGSQIPLSILKASGLPSLYYWIFQIKRESSASEGVDRKTKTPLLVRDHDPSTARIKVFGSAAKRAISFVTKTILRITATWVIAQKESRLCWRLLRTTLRLKAKERELVADLSLKVTFPRLSVSCKVGRKSSVLRLMKQFTSDIPGCEKGFNGLRLRAVGNGRGRYRIVTVGNSLVRSALRISTY